MAAVVLLGTVGSFAPPAQAAATCDRVAAAYGSDSAPGTEAAPFATPQRLASSLGAGQTGCLRAGKYIQNVKVAKGGTSGAPLTIRSYPDERATVSGRLVVADTANFVRIEGLNLDGSRAPACPTGSTCKILPSPTVNGDDVTFRYNDVTNHNTGICFVLGVPGYGRAERTLLEENRIHGCGRSPSGNYDHGVYVEYAADARIERNTIFDNVDRGVQLYPDAQRTVIRDNVIDGNGEGIIFSGDGGTTSNDSVVEGNAITNSRLRYNVESCRGQLVPSTNAVQSLSQGQTGTRAAPRELYVGDCTKRSPDRRLFRRACSGIQRAAASTCSRLDIRAQALG